MRLNSIITRSMSRPQLVRGVVLVGTLVSSLALSYGTTRALRERGRPRAPTAEDSAAARARIRRAFPSGQHLVAYVLLSHRCGFCAEKGTQRAISALRSSLATHQGGTYAKITVVGVAIDNDLDAGVKFLRGMNHESSPAFDELSVGGSWLNQFITQLVWRGGLAQAATPSVVLVERTVDASGYPSHIAFEQDSLVLRITGRDSLITWVNAGTPVGRSALETAARAGGASLSLRQ